MEFFGLANYRYLTRRLVIDGATFDNIRKQYLQYHIGKSFADRVSLIEFGVQVPSALSKEYGPPLHVLYAGRGGIQKRVWLIDRIARPMLNQGLPLVFHFAGTMEADLSADVQARSCMHGQVSDKNELNRLYQQCHVLILTSAYEGFPLVVKESMAYGCIPVVTGLPGNRTHLVHGENALLIQAIDNEDQVVAQGIALLQSLIDRPDLVRQLSRNAYQYARDHFSKDHFLQAYRLLLLSSIET